MRHRHSGIWRGFRIAAVLALTGLAFAVPLASAAGSGPSAKLTRTSHLGLKLVVHWQSSCSVCKGETAGINAFYLYIKHRKNQQIYNLPTRCTPRRANSQQDVIECIVRQYPTRVLEFSVSPRYPGGQVNTVQLVSGGDNTVMLTVVGP